MSQNRNSRCARNRRLPYGRTLCLAPYSLIRIGISISHPEDIPRPSGKRAFTNGSLKSLTAPKAPIAMA